jgi:putative nucleotidyltransferase with HDIG domain
MRIFKRRRLVKRGLTAAVKRASGESHPVLVYLNSGVVPRAITGLVLLVGLTFVVSGARDLALPHVGREAERDVIATINFRYPDEDKRLELRTEARDNVPAILRLDEVSVSKRFGAYATFLLKAYAPAATVDATAGADAETAGADAETAGADAETAGADAETAGAGAETASADTARTQPTGGDAAATETQRRELRAEAAKLFPALAEAGEIDALLSDPAYAHRLAALRDVVLALSAVRTFAEASYHPVIAVPECVAEPVFYSRLGARIDEAFKATEPPEVISILKLVARDAVQFTADPETRRMLRDEVADRVPQQFTEVKRLTTIVHRGEKVTPQHRVILQAYSEALEAEVSRKTRLSYQGLVAIIVFVLLGVSGVYLWRFEPRVFERNSKLMLIGFSSLLALGLSVGLGRLDPSSDWLRYPVLVALPVMIIAMAFPLRLAFFITMVLSLLSGIHYNAMMTGMMIHPTFVLLGLVGGSAAALYARTIRYRREFVRTGAMIGLLNLLVIVVLGLLRGGGIDYHTLLRQGGGGLAAGVLATTLAWVLLPTVETVFHITTNVGLIELGDSNHPLLKRMVMEAPGTYHHSLVVGNLAESAAEAIGANPLLARVGALYHDIGKLKKPDYFSENERMARSRHDTLIPSMSSLIITSHVKDGIDLGYKYRLKPALIDIIREHHGTSLVYYFYKRAEQMNGEQAGVDEADYRYPGPKPQTKEAAIIMLADAVEAAARAMEKPTANKVKGLIRELILARFNDGQLDESELTLRDLHRIQEAFTHIILGTLHQRVKYPKEGEPAEEDAQEAAETPEPTGVADNPD